jgi:hypothetical protein
LYADLVCSAFYHHKASQDYFQTRKPNFNIMKKVFQILAIICYSNFCFSQNWTSLASGVDATVNALTVDTVNDLLYVGGDFTNTSGQTAYYTASWNGNYWSPLSSGMNQTVWTLEMYNGELYAGGYFNFAGGKAVSYFGKWDGTSWDTVSTLVTSSVRLLKVSDGVLYGSTWNSQMFKWDGTTLTYIPSPGGNIWALESYNNEVIAGGTFSSISGTTVNYIAKWDGNSWTPLGNGFNAYVSSLKSYNGYLYAGGEFTFSGGTPCNSIARWDGTTWTALGPGFNCNGNYTSVGAILGLNNKIYASGTICNSGGTNLNQIGEWDGTNWNAMSTGLSGSARALVNYQGSVHEGGFANYAGGLQVNHIARWDNISGIDNIENNKMSLFPNPCKSYCIIKPSNLEISKARIQITTIFGQVVSVKIEYNSDGIKINREQLPSGIYLVQLWDGEQMISVSKLIAE